MPKKAFYVYVFLKFLLIFTPLVLIADGKATDNSFSDFDQNVYIVLFNIFYKLKDCEIMYFTDSYKFNRFSFANLNSKSSGAYYLNNVNLTVRFNRHGDIHKHTQSHCSIATFYISQLTSSTRLWLFNTLIPRYGPIIRKNQDHFIFITRSDTLSDTVLKSADLGMKIRFKIALFPTAKTSVQAKTLNFFGGPNGQAQVMYISNPSQKPISSLFPDFTSKFNGRRFIWSVPKVPYRFELRRDSNGNLKPVRGYFKWYFVEITKKCNFTYHMYYSSDGGGTGRILKNGTWLGALSDVLYERCDFSIMIGLIYSRHKYIGWSPALSYEWMIFWTPSPKQFYSPKAIIWPFAPFVWFLFLMALFTTTAAFKIVDKLSVLENTSLSITSAWDYVFTTFLEQDETVKLKTTPAVRILATFWLLFALVTATAYRAKLVSLIAFPVETWIPKTFAELANSNFSVALNIVGKAGAAYSWVVSSPNPVVRKLTSRMQFIQEGESCLGRAVVEHLGCMLWIGIADYILAKNLTDRFGRVPLTQSEETAMFIIDGFNFEKRAIFAHIFERSIQSAVQMGLAIKWFQMDQDFVKAERRAWMKKENVKEIEYAEFVNDGPKQIVVKQFIGLFGLAGIGLGAATLVFLRELLCGRGRCGMPADNLFSMGWRNF